jgi:hypothetical protein
VRKLDTMLTGLLGGLLVPLLVFAAYFSIRDPQLGLGMIVMRLVDSGVITYYMSLCAIANLLLFFLFLKINADRAARGVLGATIIYAFTVLLIKVA